jgi:Tol biopolymer transport system component
MQGRAKWIVAVIVLVTSVTLLAVQSQPQDQFELVSTIAFSSNRQNLTCIPGLALEIFIMRPDGTSVQPLTDRAGCTHSDAFPNFSPDGKKIVFDSNRLTTNAGVLNISDLFLMNSDGTEQTLLTRGTSATWSPEGKYIAFNASAAYHASGGLITLFPIRNDPGAPTIDSDLFVANVDDLIAGTAVPQNITNTPEVIEEDADWSPDGTKIVFTSDPVSDNVNAPDYLNKEIYVMNEEDGKVKVTQLTFNKYEERAPSWSPDGKRIMFLARVGTRLPPEPPRRPPGYNFEICVIDADGTNFVQLTDNAVFDGTGTGAWSPDGKKIVFHRGNPSQLWTVDADTTCIAGGGCTCSAMLLGGSCETQLRETPLPPAPGINLLATWGELRVRTPTP